MGDGVVGVVLAAGASRRLGRPKQLLCVDGRPLLRRIAEQAQASSCRRVAVVLPAGDAAMAACIADLDVDVVGNGEAREGIAASIRHGIAWALRCDAGATLLVGCDQPALTAAHLDELIAAHRSGAELVGSRYAGVVGIPALFGASFFPALAGLTGDEGARRWLRDWPDVCAVDWAEGALDVDCPDDVARLQQTRRLGDRSG